VIVSLVTETAEEVGKLLQEEKTRSERYPKKINLKEIKPERHQAPRQTSKRDISTRLIPEGVFGSTKK
jgi:hypothetical protein